MAQGDAQERFLEAETTEERKWQALSLNNQSWFTRWAQVRAKEVVHAKGLMWTSGSLAIASVDPLQIGDQVDRALKWYRGQDPLEGAICWYLTATPPGDLAVRLLARGFEPNWHPHWMWCDLRDLPTQPVLAPAFAIQTVEDEPASQVDDLPYYHAKEGPARAALHRLYPHHVPTLRKSGC